ncbi:MAG: hypothetical protein ACPHXS_04350 [Flavobacteriaceae bacterium]|jgi:hypothetical protein
MFLREVKVDYDFGFIFDIDWENYEHDCLGHQQNELKDIHDKVGGFPKSLTHHNTMFYQKFFDGSEIDFKELGDQVGVEAKTISMIKQPPGMTNPMHRDTFYQINKKFPNDDRLKVRANIQLLEWKDGHFLQFNDTVITHWKAQTGYMWDSSVVHLAANAGLEDRYALQISGFLKN